MNAKIQFKTPVRRRVAKTQPTVADVHVPTALGNQRSKAKDFLTVIGEIAGGAKIVQLPTAATNVAPIDKKDGLVTVWFMRHGATRFNNQTDMSQDRVRSWNDVPLTDEGRDDAHKAGEKLAKQVGEGSCLIVSSSLGRAKETAQIVAKEIRAEGGTVEIASTPKMLPWNLGKFTGMTTDEAHDGIKHYIENPDEVIDKGESFNDFRSRAVQGMLWALKKAGRRILIVVSHHRNERLWATSGEPPTADAKIGAEKFLKPGEDPGDVTTFEFSVKALRGKAGKAGDETVGKVWDSNDDLPDGVKNSLPDEAQTVWRRVANDRINAGQSEESAIRQAWHAVKNGWRKEGDQWVRKFDGAVATFIVEQVGLAKQLPSDAIQGPGAPSGNNASLHLFPLDSDPAWAKTPFPYDQNALGKLKPDQMKPFLGALTNQDALPVRLFHMKTLVALQDRVNPDKVQSMVDDEPDDLPVVARLNGRNLIMDGHHRMTSRYLMGRKTAQAHFINLDDPDAEAKEDDKEVGAKKRWRSFGEIVRGWIRKAGPEDEPRDDRGRWAAGASSGSEAFANRVNTLVSEMPDTAPHEGKVAIAQVYEAWKKAYPRDVMSAKVFGHRLVNAAKGGLLKLARLDLPEGLPHDLRRASETPWGNDTVHFVRKRDDGFSRAFDVKKIDEDRQLVFGWASIWTIGGEYVVDKQDDIIPPDEGENAAYEFMLYHRSHGDMHERMGVGRCIESIALTKQKQDALGIDLGMEGWFVGFRVDDDEVWKRIKAGDLPEFSIGGKATREDA